mgnify:CR=1 FL=1
MKNMLTNLRFFIFSFTFFNDEDLFCFETKNKKDKSCNLFENLFVKLIFYFVYLTMIIISPFSESIYDSFSNKSWITGKNFLNKVKFEKKSFHYTDSKNNLFLYIKKNLWNIVGDFFSLQTLVISINKFVIFE